MITNSKQNWEIGQKVKVGFMADLIVIGKKKTPGDYAPDAYLLFRNNTKYVFVPHNGIEKVWNEEMAQGFEF